MLMLLQSNTPLVILRFKNYQVFNMNMLWATFSWSESNCLLVSVLIFFVLNSVLLKRCLYVNVFKYIHFWRKNSKKSLFRKARRWKMYWFDTLRHVWNILRFMYLLNKTSGVADIPLVWIYISTDPGRNTWLKLYILSVSSMKIEAQINSPSYANH